MALPIEYSEVTFAEYLHGLLYGISGVLGWSVADDSYAEIINDTLVSYGAADITTITGEANLVRLRTIGKYQVWRAAVDGLASKYDYRQNNETFDLEKLQAHANVALRQAEQAASAYGVGSYTIRTQRVVRTQEPYGYLPSELQVIP
jgi:hypothetical protein